MSDINTEMADMADNMSKSSTDSIDLIKSKILEMGPEQLKKAVETMDAASRDTLKSVLDEMSKAHKSRIKNPKKTAEPVINTTPNGDYKYNEEERMAQDFQDEKVMAEIEKDGQQIPRNQGGIPIEGWEGQIIKGIKLPNPMKPNGELNKNDDTDLEFPKKVAVKPKKELKTMQKSEFIAVLARMQERNLEKSSCISKLSETTGFEKSKVEAIWDELAKSSSYKYDDGTVGSDVPEAKQSETPETKDNAKAKAGKAEDRGGDSKTTADEGEKPPATMKKSGEDATANLKKSNVDENFTLAKARNPFTERNIGQNCHYKVDEFLANEYVESFQKGNFDYSPKEGPAGINELLEKGLDMDCTALNQAIAVKASEELGKCFVKSFSDEDLLEVQERTNIWDESDKDEIK